MATPLITKARVFMVTDHLPASETDQTDITLHKRANGGSSTTITGDLANWKQQTRSLVADVFAAPPVAGLAAIHILGTTTAQLAQEQVVDTRTAGENVLFTIILMGSGIGASIITNMIVARFLDKDHKRTHRAPSCAFYVGVLMMILSVACIVGILSR